MVFCYGILSWWRQKLKEMAFPTVVRVQHDMVQCFAMVQPHQANENLYAASSQWVWGDHGPPPPNWIHIIPGGAQPFAFPTIFIMGTKGGVVAFRYFKVISVSHSVVSNSLWPYGLWPTAPLSIEFSRQEYWSGLPFPTPGDLPDPGIEPGFPALQVDSLPS